MHQEFVYACGFSPHDTTAFQQPNRKRERGDCTQERQRRTHADHQRRYWASGVGGWCGVSCADSPLLLTFCLHVGVVVVVPFFFLGCFSVPRMKMHFVAAQTDRQTHTHTHRCIYGHAYSHSTRPHISCACVLLLVCCAKVSTPVCVHVLVVVHGAVSGDWQCRWMVVGVCMCTCVVFVHVYVCIHMCLRPCASHMNVCILFVFLRMRGFVRIHACVCVLLRAFSHVCVCVVFCVRIFHMCVSVFFECMPRW